MAPFKGFGTCYNFDTYQSIMSGSTSEKSTFQRIQRLVTTRSGQLFGAPALLLFW